MAAIVCACGRSVETQPEWAGQWITCPGCKGTLYAPFPGPKPAPVPQPLSMPAPDPGPTRLCPTCSETIPMSDAQCRFCGAEPRTERPVRVEARPMGSSAPLPEGDVPALVVGLIGYMFCGLLCPFGWWMGRKYEAQCRQRGVSPSSAGRAATIVGIVGTVFFVLNMVGFALWVVAQCL